MTFGFITWLFVAAVAAHNLEEAIWLPSWSQSVGKWHPAVTAFEFRFAVVILTVLAAVAAALAHGQGKGSIGAYLITGYALAMLLNVIFPHVLVTLILRRYTPGLATAIFAITPATTSLIWSAFRENVVELYRFLVVGPIEVASILISIPMLFWLARKSEQCCWA
ncbi:Protein of unknown function with HXXEE motif-containing protein [Bradyrhizobium sp. Rc2d]|uniref:HXXEE domain-containing protein n=1 Tax=Bradyrhizobium sp. Rc2d TaxID=1855321 RepID=UPI000889CF25|nr:HXXEE domain-containing protein [Bradyrhizobium sp. Rc2d]SDJ07820.1 Protein of unknown function with HXXEE motif-containing protein [Bradyrhizobium sp. Rc2d]